MQVANQEILRKLYAAGLSDELSWSGKNVGEVLSQEEELGKGDEKLDARAKARQVLKSALEAIYDPEDEMTEEEHAAYEKKLIDKVRSGKKLTAQEMNYLRVHNPEAYWMARRVEYKRMKLEQRLKHCKSKEEAQEIYNTFVGQVSDEDPDKEALLNTYKNTFDEFKKTIEYARLPETKREAEAEKLHGKKKKLYLEGKLPSEEEEWLLDLDQDYFDQDLLMKLEEEDLTPLIELLDELPVLDITG